MHSHEDAARNYQLLGWEIVIGRAPAILGWAYVLLGPAVDTSLCACD